ncbi:hypothetical protein JQ600_35430 [Bradyrhizobium sp. AUGA SZCCT0176]|uniref:hypothetical protein n=1 Tax=Bradyrhizobium sp. AUGA SZCCT0176 TaxID=2807664 RepID=UPI001BA812A7|nr:hypothetical protein [Bradyrhizobium sp. AUGA SZCCT0176]MBR1230189.1 hypothetical protein [Bradyrhizobium sp. AUGA SZCCT0176]
MIVLAIILGAAALVFFGIGALMVNRSRTPPQATMGMAGVVLGLILAVAGLLLLLFSALVF